MKEIGIPRLMELRLERVFIGNGGIPNSAKPDCMVSAFRGLTDASYGLRDDQWDRNQGFSSRREGLWSARRPNRLFVEAFLDRFFGPASRGGIFQSVRDCQIGPQRFAGGEDGVFDRVFTAVGERSRQRIHDDRRTSCALTSIAPAR